MKSFSQSIKKFLMGAVHFIPLLLILAGVVIFLVNVFSPRNNGPTYEERYYELVSKYDSMRDHNAEEYNSLLSEYEELQYELDRLVDDARYEAHQEGYSEGYESGYSRAMDEYGDGYEKAVDTWTEWIYMDDYFQETFSAALYCFWSGEVPKTNSPEFTLWGIISDHFTDYKSDYGFPVY